MMQNKSMLNGKFTKLSCYYYHYYQIKIKKNYSMIHFEKSCENRKNNGKSRREYAQVERLKKSVIVDEWPIFC